MSHTIESKLEVLYEIVKRIESDVQEVKEKVTVQNGNVARIESWRVVHDEQAERRTAHISKNENDISLLKKNLRVLLFFSEYPKMGIFLIVAAVVFMLIDFRIPFSSLL
jgi:ribosomal protein S20